MLQQVINYLYRYPKNRLVLYKRFGGYLSYRKMLKNHELMKEASLKLKPVACFNDGLPIYFLTGKNYLHQTLFCIHSLINSTKERFCIHLIDDGSFDSHIVNKIQNMLPGAIVIDYKVLQTNVERELPVKEFPVLHKKRAEYPHIKKLTDIHLLSTGRDWKLVLDSDMLFWKEPSAIIEWLKAPNCPLHMVDCGEAYGYPIDTLSMLANEKVPELVNVGAIGLNSRQIDWKTIENWIKTLEDQYGKSYYLEQALSAMLVGSGKSTVLNRQDYLVNPTSKQVQNRTGVLQHYVDLSKAPYYNLAWKKIQHT